MARTRTIDRTALLDAAHRVVVRDGATRLTLDAVAAEAGISKASVLYDYKSKRALIKAVIEHEVATEVARLRTMIGAMGERPNAVLLGLLAAVKERKSAHKRNVALDLAVALNQHNDLRAKIQETFGSFINDVSRTSSNPRRAMTAFLALHGLKQIEDFGFYTWQQEDRDQLLRDIRSLIEPETPKPLDRS